MKHLLFLPALLLAFACSGSTLNGGTAQLADASTETDGGSSGSVNNPAAPLKGTVNGAPFVPQAIDIEYSQGVWSLVLYNQPRPCHMGTLPLGPETTIVTIRNIEPKAGTELITNKKNTATFQTGLYMADAGEPVIDPAVSGTLTLNTWSEVVDAEITGTLELYGDNNSDIRGAFTATVCAKR